MICRCGCLQPSTVIPDRCFFTVSLQAQNDAAAAAAVGGGLEETLMGVEEYDKELAMLLRRNTDMLSQIKQDLRETKIALEATDD